MLCNQLYYHRHCSRNLTFGPECDEHRVKCQACEQRCVDFRGRKFDVLVYHALK